MLSLFQVTARWLLDLQQFNEWMVEEDYLLNDEFDVSQSFPRPFLLSFFHPSLCCCMFVLFWVFFFVLIYYFTCDLYINYVFI